MKRKFKEDYLIINPDPFTFRGNNIDLDFLPKVSFVIPTFNNERTIGRCLKSIVKQNYPDFEVIIVDNGSTDTTIEIAEKYVEKVYFDDGPVGSVRQTGVEQSKGTVLALFDSDIIIPHEMWLIDAIKYFNYSNDVSTVWSLKYPPRGSSLTAKLYSNISKIFKKNRIKKGISVFGGGNALFLKSCINDIGGINRSIHWGEDFDWAIRLKNKGYKVVYICDPLYHDTMQSLKEFSKKQFVGAETFTVTGFGIMNITLQEVLYEHFVLGTREMFKGLFIKKDISWLIYPYFLLIRVTGYIYTYVKNIVKRRKDIANS